VRVSDTWTLQVLLAGITGAVAGAISMALSEFIGVCGAGIDLAACKP
jgi:hypothetical protein